MARTIDLLGVPLDRGAARRGAALAPAALRAAGLVAALRAAGRNVDDRGDMAVPAQGPDRSDASNCRHAALIADVCGRLAGEVEAAIGREALPLVLGGDHSISIGSIGGVARRGRTAVLWFDAHGDFNTPETTPSGNIHGMPLAVLCGLGDPGLIAATGRKPALDPAAVALIATRSLDPGERLLLHAHGVRVYAMDAIRRRGIRAVVGDALAHVLEHADQLHVSLDLDSLDPRAAPGVGTPVPGGLTFDEAQQAMALVAQAGLLTAMDIVEVNPLLDQQRVTARQARDLACVALGAGTWSSRTCRRLAVGATIPPSEHA